MGLGGSAKTGRAEVYLTIAQNYKITKITYIVYFALKAIRWSIVKIH